MSSLRMVSKRGKAAPEAGHAVPAPALALIKGLAGVPDAALDVSPIISGGPEGHAREEQHQGKAYTQGTAKTLMALSITAWPRMSGDGAGY